MQSYNPQVTEALLRMARIASDDLDFIDKEGARLWEQIAREQENTVALDKERLLRLPPALQRQMLRFAIEKLSGTLKDIEARHIELLIAALTKPAGRRIRLPYGLSFSIEYDRYLLGPDPAALSPFPLLDGEFALKILGKTRLPGWQVEATVAGREQFAEKHDNLTAYFDRDKVGNKLTVRPRQSGDRFQPLGMSQPKKLGEFMIDAKIPQAWRERVPVVCSPSQIVWVVGWRIDNRVKVTKATKEVLRLEFKRS